MRRILFHPHTNNPGFIDEADATLMAQLPSPPHDPRPAAPVSSSGELRSATTRPCPSCSTPVGINASICPACGDALPAHNQRIRCRRCGGRAAAALVVCPHCGRELQAAPPRLLTWGAPLLLILLFAAVFLMQVGGASPAAWTARQVGRVASLVDSLGARLQPDITITTIPVAEEEAGQLVSQPQPTPAQVAEAAQPPTAGASATEAPTAPAEAPPASDATTGQEAPLPTATVTTAPTQAPSPTPAPPTATPSATPTTPPTATPTTPPTATPPPPTATPAPSLAAPSATAATGAPTVRAAGAVTTTGRTTLTNTLALVATATPAPATSLALALPTPTPADLAPTATPNLYRIRAGDTLFELAMANDLSLETLLAANNLTEDDVYTIQPGDDIVIPDPNATPAPTATTAPTPTPAATDFTYTVRAGDTLMAIGLRFDVNIQRILDANGLTLAQARALRTGQELIIPGAAGSAPTATSQATPTAAPVAASPATATPVAGMRLDAPALRSPENGASVQCGAGEQLVWGAVPFVQPTDLYVVHLGYVNGRAADGAEQVVWVLAQPRASNVTLWQLDDSLCGLAPFEYGRQWRWYVDMAEKAADGTLTAVSQPSATWGFTWQ